MKHFKPRIKARLRKIGLRSKLKPGLKASINKNKQFTPEEAKIAQKQFLGMLVSSATLAGIAGMPFVGLILGALNLFVFDDEEEPAEIRANRLFGEFLWKGPTSAVLGTDISGRVGLSNLLFRNNPYAKDDSILESIFKFENVQFHNFANSQIC